MEVIDQTFVSDQILTRLSHNLPWTAAQTPGASSQHRRRWETYQETGHHGEIAVVAN